jgi:glutathione S-transferase
VPARLITIPISHFCEKARWALDRAGVDYVEERHVQLVHVLAARRAGGGRTVPVLVTADGRVLRESSEILRWADAGLYPGDDAAALEARFDAGLGPDGRLWMYHQTLPVVKDLGPWALAGVPRWERAAFRWGVRGVEPAIRRLLDVDAGTAATALERVDAVFDAVAARLADGRRFLATIDPWHGHEVAICFATDPAAMKPFGPRTVLDDTLDAGHALWVADVDGDGDDEVFAGFRGQGTSVLAYDFDGSAWTRTVLDDAIAAQDLRGGDLDGDGTPDVVAIGGATHNVVWYRKR